MKKNKDLSWVPSFNRATTCPCKVKINFKQHHKNYAGPKKEVLDEWCKRHSFCKEVDAIYISDQFHPGSDFCIRTNPGKNMEYVTRNKYIDGGKPQEGSNQCCYGHENDVLFYTNDIKDLQKKVLRDILQKHFCRPSVQATRFARR